MARISKQTVTQAWAQTREPGAVNWQCCSFCHLDTDLKIQTQCKCYILQNMRKANTPVAIACNSLASENRHTSLENMANHVTT